MVYTCQFCGAWYPKEVLLDVNANKEKFITCPYCSNVSEVENVKKSHVTKGYDFLESGDFYHALTAFNEALKEADKTNTGYEGAKLEAYLGKSLAQQSVQVIYTDEDEIATHTAVPEINCYRYDDTFLGNSNDYNAALNIAYNIPFSYRDEAIARIERFAKKIDGIKLAYNKRANLGEEYQLFIAYEDRSKDTEAGFRVANTIRDRLPSSIKRVYIPDPTGMTEEEYEGALLYATLNSTCMLVVVDDDMDARLMNLYARYYYGMCDAKEKRRALGFVSIGKEVHVHLPDHGISRNVFDISNVDGFCSFVCEANMIAYGTAFFAHTEAVPKREEEIEVSTQTLSYVSTDVKDGAPVFNGQTCHFGSYPQHRILDQNIIDAFANEGKPSISSPNGWEIMFRSRTGQPYTWYKDKIVNGRKYRAVYFIKFREVFTSRNTDIMPSIQRMANYTPMRIYVFAYDDIEWNILQFSRNSVIMMSSVGLESREYNTQWDAWADWDSSSLREWLNHDLLDTAFTPEERKHLYHIDGSDDSLSLISGDYISNSSNSVLKKLNTFNIVGSDYLKCIGGYCDRAVSSFWIRSDSEADGSAAAVQPHDMKNLVSQFVDNTTVAVLPLVEVKIEE